jgi:Asp-tRNA(Asn)/Glu-tRNA(Gln) amidotransferase A subunit family amidase
VLEAVPSATTDIDGPDRSSADLCYLSATEALRAFAARKLSPVELLLALIDRVEVVNPVVNALTETYFDDALERARFAEAIYTGSTCRDPRPLEGLPVAIKDLHPVRGLRTTFGSRLFEHHIAEYTLPTVQRLVDAGAIIHIRTTTSELGYSGVVRTDLWGSTRNPWNLRFGPAGSSGGAGVALATGMAPLADGSDGGGSIRNPAAACGVVGYKPPLGRNPVDPALPFETLVQYGPLARSVADCALAQNVMSGPHRQDANTHRCRKHLPSRFKPIKGWRVAFTMDYGYFSVDSDVQRNTVAALDAFRELGCAVVEVKINWDLGVRDAWMAHWEGLFASIVDRLPIHDHRFDPVLEGILARGRVLPASRLFDALRVRARMYETLAAIFADHDILVSPTLAVPAPLADAVTDDPAFAINGRAVDAYIGWQLTYPYNLISQIPAISVPSGLSSTGVPTGLHIAGRTFDDLSVFQAAAAFEAARPWRDRRPPL